MPRGPEGGERLTRRMLTESFRERFWAKVDKDSAAPCWLWTASTTRQGHPQISLHGSPSRLVQGRRAAWVLCKGALRPGTAVRLTCETTHCVNPDHMVAGPGLKIMVAAMQRFTDTEIAEIRNDLRTMRIVDVAVKWGCSSAMVGRIFRNVSYVDRTYKPGRRFLGRKLTFEDLEAIRDAYDTGVSIRTLAKNYDVAYSTIWYTVTGVVRDRPSLGKFYGKVAR